MGAQGIAIVLVRLATDNKAREAFFANREAFLDTCKDLTEDDKVVLKEFDEKRIADKFLGTQHSDPRSIVIKIEVPK